MRTRPEPDRIARLVRDRPATLARWALASWATGAAVAIAEQAAGGRGWLGAALAFPAFAVTATASVSLFHRDPERAGLDALRGGLLATIPAALLLGRAAVRSFPDPAAGRIALVCMAGAAIGLVVGALAGPVAGWGLRALGRSARALIRGVPRR